MQWEQLTAAEISALHEALDYMQKLHFRNGGIATKSWNEYLEKCAPTVSNPSTEQLATLQTQLNEFGGAIKTFDDRMLLAWSLFEWVNAMDAIANDSGMNVKEIRSLVQRIKKTISEEEYTLLCDIVAEEYGNKQLEPYSSPTKAMYSLLLDELADIAITGRALSDLNNSQWVILRINIENRGKREPDSEQVKALLKWMQTVKQAHINHRIQQTNWTPVVKSLALEEYLGAKKRLDAKNEHQQYRFYNSMSMQEQVQLVKEIGISPGMVADVRLIESDIKSRVVFYSNQKLLMTSVEKSLAKLDKMTIMSINTELDASEVSKLTAKAIESGIKTAVTTNSQNTTQLVLTSAKLDANALLDYTRQNLSWSDSNAVYLVLQKVEDECLSILYGDIVKQSNDCELLFPLKLCEFKEMVLQDASEWVFANIKSAAMNLVSCPNCAYKTKNVSVFDIEQTQQSMCLYRIDDKLTWTRGCGYNFLDDMQKEYVIKNIQNLNQPNQN